jgi:hypothetical protein
MDAQELRALQEAYMNVYQLDEISPEFVLAASKAADKKGKPAQASRLYKKFAARDQAANYAGYQRSSVNNEEVEIYDVILSHLLDEGYASTEEAATAIMANMSEDWRQDIMEKENSEYEKASDAALDKRYGYGRASGDKHSFGRAANRSSAAAALRAIRRGERSGSGTSTEAGSDAVHQGWARTAKTSADQTPEKKERRAGLANTPYSKLPEDEKEKDRVSFNAVRAVYNRNKR